jgi:hypothetical protein
MIKLGLLCCSLILLLFVSRASAAMVGGLGYTNSFNTQPPAADWATASIAGAGGDNYVVDTDVNANITATAVTVQAMSASGNPPTQSALAVWSSNGYLQTRPTANRYTALMAKFVNNTGTNWTEITVSYLFTIAGSAGVPEESDKGTRVYYSLSGLANSWINIPALNTTTSANGATAFCTVVPLTWTNAGNLFLLWIDDNAGGSGVDSANQLDNFSLTTKTVCRDEFLAMLDELEAAGTPTLRGFDQGINSFNNIGNRVVAMVGSAETWDAYGTPALRNAVITRWRNRWDAEGAAMLRGLNPPKPLPGHVALEAANIRIERSVANIRTPFFLNNGRLFELGAMDGNFPPMAFMLGDQSGIWAPPVKALDGFSFVVRESGAPDWPLVETTEFSHDFASATFGYATNGWRATRLDFPAEKEPALFSRLTLTNTSANARNIEVDFMARVNIRPDWRTFAQSNQLNDLDIIEVTNGLVRAWDRNLTNSLTIVGTDRAVDSINVRDATVTLTRRVAVPAGSAVTLNFLVLAVLDPVDANAAQTFRDLAQWSDIQLASARNRKAGRISNGVSFSCSDARLTEAFVLAKANLALLTADYRPHFPDVFLAAGIPVYPRLFANDSCISLPGAMAAGLTMESRGTLSCLAAQARMDGGLVPHESANDSKRIGRANAQETPQFIATCARYLRWSNDRTFLTSVYPLLKDAVTAQRAKDTDDDGYPEGSALIETPGGGPERLDAACWQYAALAGLAQIATDLGEPADAAALNTEAASLRAAIQRDWWMPTNAIWADSIGTTNQPLSAGVWSVVFPLLTGVATAEQAESTLDALRQGWVNQWGGVHTRAPDISNTGSGVVTTDLFAAAAFAHGQPDFGLRLLRLAANAPRQARMPGGFSETIPPGGSDPVQLWSAGPFLEAVIEGLAGVQPEAQHHRADFIPKLPPGIEGFKLEHLRIGEHEFTLEQKRNGYQNIATVTHHRGPVAFTTRFFSSSNALFTLNGRNLPSQPVPNGEPPRTGRVASCEMSVGDKLTVTFRDTYPMSCSLVPFDSQWKYLDDGSDQGTAWRTPSFNDATWLVGPGEFGYGDGDEATLIRSNRTDNSRIITTWFRKAFLATNVWAMTNLTLDLVRDDGAIVFLNGTEIFRSNMPAGAAGFLSTAITSVNGGDEAAAFSVNVNPALLVEGTNLLAVEIHQQSTASSDISFNLALNSVGYDRTELTARLLDDRVQLAWPLLPAGFSLESASALWPTSLWQLENEPVTVTNGENILILDPASALVRFFRLRR